MRFIHAADIHIGSSKYLPDYLERQEKALRVIYRSALKHDCDFVLLCGDIFHRRGISHPEKDVFIRTLAEFDRKIATVMINGQHDVIDGDYTHLRILYDLMCEGKLPNTTIVEVEPTKVPFTEPRVNFICVPFGHYDTETFNATVEGLIKKVKDDSPIIVLAHGICRGSVLDNDFVFKDGVELDIDLPVAYWAWGDIHAQQQIEENAWYCGSPIQHDFGDAAESKGFLIVEIDNDSRELSVTPRRVGGVKDLVTLVDAPEEWPEDAWVRFRGSASTLAQTELPAAVVRVQHVFEAASERLEDAATFDDVLAGLPEVLAEAGLDEADVELGVEKAEGYVKHLG